MFWISIIIYDKIYIFKRIKNLFTSNIIFTSVDV